MGYLCGATLEFTGVSKCTKELETVEITVASAATTKKYLIESPILVYGHLITISFPESTANPNAPIALSTSVIVKGLLSDYSQNQVTTALYKILCP